MAIRAKKQSSWFTVLLIIAAVAVWAIDQKKSGSSPKSDPKPRTEQKSASPTSTSAATQQGGYEVYRNCQLVPEKNNDGDSFRVRLPDGREEIMRLYFVDTPESAFKSYRGGETNHQRIQEQAEYFHTSPEKAVEIGQQGKHFTLELLARQPFTIYTRWDSPFHDQRYHAFIEVTSAGKPRWLHVILVEKGLARLKTKPADLPDGTPASKHRQQLEAAKQKAMQAKVGAWAK